MLPKTVQGARRDLLRSDINIGAIWEVVRDKRCPLYSLTRRTSRKSSRKRRSGGYKVTLKVEALELPRFERLVAKDPFRYRTDTRAKRVWIDGKPRPKGRALSARVCGERSYNVIEQGERAAKIIAYLEQARLQFYVPAFQAHYQDLVTRADEACTTVKEWLQAQYPHGVPDSHKARVGQLLAERDRLESRVAQLRLEFQWDRVDRARGVIQLEVTKGGRRREVPLNSRADGVLERRAKAGTEGYVFRSQDWNGYQTAWLRAVKRAQLADFRFHDLRHTFASWAVQNGASLQEVKDLLGHRTLAMVLRYAHLAPEHLRAAAGRLDAVLDAPTRIAQEVAQEVNGIEVVRSK
jgi:hypothetical protein